VQRLRLARTPTSVAVFGGKRTECARGKIALKLSPLGGGTGMTVAALVFPRLTIYDDGIKPDTRAWNHLSGLELADPNFLKADPVDILLGANVFAAILQEGLRKGEPHQPMAQRTSLGWILSRAVGSAAAPRCALTDECNIEEDLSAFVRQFWQQEELLVKDSSSNPEEQRCEDFFSPNSHSHARRSLCGPPSDSQAAA